MPAAYLDSSLGSIEITATDAGITSITFTDGNKKNNDTFQLLELASTQLKEYFSGKRTTFDLPLDPQGTDFQKRVWNELLNIPFGVTVSYLEIAKRLGDMKAIRAVGMANGKNPISIVIPCHRVIGSNGKLVGYGGGLWRKEWLLHHEKTAEGSMLF